MRNTKPGHFQKFWQACSDGDIEYVQTSLNEGFYPELLTEVDDANKVSALHIAASNQKLEVVKVLLNFLKSNPDLLEKAVLKSDEKKISPLYEAAFLQYTEIIKEFFYSLKEHPKLLKRAINNSPEPPYISLINHLVMMGDEEVMQLLLNLDSNIEVTNLPLGYYSGVLQTAIYYLNQLTQKFNKPNTENFQAAPDGSLRNVKLTEITLSSQPIIIASSDGSKVILSGYVNNSANSIIDSSALNKAFTLANKEGINSIVCVITDEKYLEDNTNFHALTLKLTRASSNSEWEALIHDPNYSFFVERVLRIVLKPISFIYKPVLIDEYCLELCKKIYSDIFPDTNISVKMDEVIIENIGDSYIGGYCNMISSIVAAAYLTETESQLRDYCANKGKNFIKKLAAEFNPAIDKVLRERLEYFKAKFGVHSKEDTSTEEENSNTLNHLNAIDGSNTYIVATSCRSLLGYILERAKDMAEALTDREAAAKLTEHLDPYNDQEPSTAVNHPTATARKLKEPENAR